MRHASLGAIVVLALTPLVGASSLLLGSEAAPELPDAEDDVEYSSLYVGPKDLEYLDLTAAWFSFDARRDTIGLTMRTTSAEALAAAASTSEVRCAVQGDLIRDDSPTGALQFLWIKPSNSTVLDTRVYSIQDTSAATGVGTRIPHLFDARFDEPGYFEFTVNRTALMQYGDSVENPTGICFEMLRPALVPPDAGNLGYRWASDEAASQAAYSFVDHRRSRTASGEPEPWEEEESEHAEPTSRPTAEQDSPAPAFFVATVVLFSVAMVAKATRERPPRP